MQIRYHELAQADLLAAWSWYEDQQPGLGDQFITAVDVSLDQIAGPALLPRPDRARTLRTAFMAR